MTTATQARPGPTAGKRGPAGLALVGCLVLLTASLFASVSISLTAPQIAQRVTRSGGPHLVTSTLMGALLLVLADLAAQQLPLFDNLPVGIYTMAVGGAYLGWLLVGEWRRQSA
ncbi:hypothetical protein GCM10010278_77960 [Streptomyces melanogenes]|nr:hypothetical protein GCM10010278_77960 [Streptomyces melanogenes]